MKRLLRIGRFQILFAWYDLWVGAYYDVGYKILYIIFIPTIVLRFEFPGKKNKLKHRQDR